MWLARAPYKRFVSLSLAQARHVRPCWSDRTPTFFHNRCKTDVCLTSEQVLLKDC